MTDNTNNAMLVWAKTEKEKQFGHNVVNKVLVRFWHPFQGIIITFVRAKLFGQQPSLETRFKPPEGF